jgi:hypothetical protein
MDTNKSNHQPTFWKGKTMTTKSKHDHDMYPGENVAILTPAPIEDMWGFFGTMKTIADEDVAIIAWESASLTLSSCFKEDDPAVVRNFLRSRYGRHLADRVTFYANEEEYGDSDIMRSAVMDAILAIHESGRNKGKSVWTEWFTDIKKATESGEWED